MDKPKRPRPTLTNAVEWIAFNDNDSLDTPQDLPEIAEQLTVVLVADLFNIPAASVAHRILKLRQERK